MTPDLPARLRREAALWLGSKLAELLTQAAEQMEAATTTATELIGTYCDQLNQAEAQLAAVTSADSMAWSYRARKAWEKQRRPLGTGCTTGCANCLRWALQWRDGVLDLMERTRPVWALTP